MRKINKEINIEEKININRFFKSSSGGIKIILIIIICLIIFLCRISKEPKKVEKIHDLYNIKSPVQMNTTGEVIKKIDDISIKITYVATYTLSGRVVDVQKYSQGSIDNKLSPIDVGVSWGILAREENHSKLKWSSSGNRFLNWSTKDNDWFNKIGKHSSIQSHHSNNHLIPHDDKIIKYIKQIKKDDYIKIEGYLVNVYYEKANGSYFYWNSSTSRNDSGDGACELIYVTDIIWLED